MAHTMNHADPTTRENPAPGQSTLCLDENGGLKLLRSNGDVDNAGGGAAPFGSDFQGQQLNLVGTGQHVIIPAPPEGYVRCVGLGTGGGGMRYRSGAFLVPSDGGFTLPVGTVDLQQKIGTGIDVGAPLVGAASSMSFPFNALSMVLTEADDFILDVTSLDGGADRLVGWASWIDILSTDIVVRTAVDISVDGTPIDVIPAVPSGQVALQLTDPSMAYILALDLLYIDNLDDIQHNFTIHAVLGNGAFQIGTETTPAGATDTVGVAAIASPVFEGDSITITMAEPVSTVAPKFYYAYKLVTL